MEWCAGRHWAAAYDEGLGEPKWLKLARYYNRPADCRPQMQSSIATAIVSSPGEIPSDLKSLIDDIRALQLDRTPFVSDGECINTNVWISLARTHSVHSHNSDLFLPVQLQTA